MTELSDREAAILELLEQTAQGNQQAFEELSGGEQKTSRAIQNLSVGCGPLEGAEDVINGAGDRRSGSGAGLKYAGRTDEQHQK